MTAMQVAVLLPSAAPPEEVLELARLADRVGLAEVWVPEDLGCHGGMATAGAILGSTGLRVGLGVAALGVRHLSVLAQEIASLRRSFGDRFIPGLGLGLRPHFQPMGIYPERQLAAVRDHVRLLRGLLRGDEVTESTALQDLHRVRLRHPVEGEVPLHLGAVGPRLLGLSGEIADGTVGSVCAGPGWVAWAREQAAAGALAAGRGPGSHRMTTYCLASLDEDHDRAVTTMVGPLTATVAAIIQGGLADLLVRSGVAETDRYEERRASPESLSEWIAEQVVPEVSVCGDRSTVARRLAAYDRAGTDCLVLSGGTTDKTATLIQTYAAWFIPPEPGMAREQDAM